MAKRAIVGEKLGMTQVWDASNVAVPVTVLRVDATRVVQLRTPERDGYSALQVTYGHKDAAKLTKPLAGHYASAGVQPGKRLLELRLDDISDYQVGQEIAADVFEPGDIVDVTAISKGKGFAGPMKRHNFKGQGASHGAHRVHRMPGSIGQCATPSRVFKGVRMAGRMGGTQVTTLNLEVVRVDPDQGVILIKGAVPGPRGGVVIVRNAIKAPTRAGGES